MTGLAVLTRKELLESWRTLRLPIVGGLFVLVGLTSPLLARFLPEIVKAAGGDQLTAIQIPTPVLADAIDQLWKNLAQFGAFAAIILSMGAVSGELDRGTAAFVLSKTASRGAFLAAKVVAIGAVLGISTILAVALGWIYTAILFEPPAPGGWVAFALLAWLGLCAWGAITFLGSAITGSTAAAAGIGFVALLGLSVVSAIPNVSRLGPGGLAGPAIDLAAGSPVDAGDLLVAVASTVILIVAALGLAAWSFRRREI
jgi:ABC-2 type transport system permease protein